MTSLDSPKNSNGYSKRRFFMGCYSQSTSAFGNLSPASGVQGPIIWCPVTKKYYCGDISNTNSKVYSRTPGGLWTLVHTGSGNGVGLFWSRRLGMLVYFTSTHIYTSVDGTTWVSRTVPAGYAPTGMSCFCDASTYSIFFASEASTTQAYKSTDGIVWARSILAGSINFADRCGCLNGSDTVVVANEDSSNGYLFYTTNGTSFTSIVSATAMYGYFPPTPLRQEHWYIDSTTAYRSTDGVSFSNASRGIRTGSFTGLRSLAFGGVMIDTAGSSTVNAVDFLNTSQSMTRFSDVMAGNTYANLPTNSQATTQGEFLSSNNASFGWVPRPVGTWLEPGDTMCILIGGGGQNVSTTVGGCAGAMVRHKFTVTEKYRWIAYNIAGATAIVDVGGSDGLQQDNFLAYASFSAYNAQPGPNQACFGDEVYYGMPALGGNNAGYGAACGPSGGSPAYRGLSSTSLGCGTTATTTATTPNDWWDPEDWVGNPSGTGYPGTAGSSAATIGLLGASTGGGVFGSYGSGGCNTSSAFSQRGGEALAIIYSN
jgi:hypothetical protein